ncbi:stage II sporulation protein P [Desulfosporosinus sp. Tol-M]|nr:stage II sporulation protein P [Desulfosporosinus sp. Tol-M]
MLREDFYRQKKHFRIWRVREWARGFLLGLVSILIILGLVYAFRSGSSRQLIGFLTQQSFPFEAILMEGAPGFSQPERARLDLIRNQGAAVSMFLLTGVNIADPRTFFLGYFSSPPQGPAWLGWAYNPNDPEFEGPILEPIELQQPEGNTEFNLPMPVAGAKEIGVGIYNTHNSECYAGDGGPDHRFGENGDVVTVGETLKKILGQNGIGAVHSLQIHDAVDYMKAYSKSIVTATQLIKDYPSMKLLIDVHRNGLPPGVQSSITIKGQSVSRVLVVIGKKNPHWQKNEALAKELIALGEKKYPGLFLPNINYAADARYNQHLSDGALLLEFGSQYNTLGESNGAAEAVAEILADYLKKS